ncbi:MAG TPA: biopolymer transporter ExbD [candidate division Zixibacteria bacterium]|nr:biopolymer transporter ExbD [candidate division Zixibacteria bacterium]
MAGVDLASGRPPGKRTATLRRPKRRVGIRIDMTPMVDIAFLLLIFYMVTTIFMQPQAMEISLPPDKEKSVPIKESNLLIFRVDEDGTVYKNFGKEKPEIFGLDTLRTYLIRENQEKPKLVTFIKIHEDAKYAIMVELIDEMQVVEKLLQQRDPGFSYRFAVAPLSEQDIKELQATKTATKPS